MLHLQRLDQELRLDHTADAGFEIKKIVAASAFVGDPDQHVFDLPDEIGTRSGLTPELLGERVKFKAQSTGDRARPRQRLQLPKLRARLIIVSKSFERTDERPLL